MIEDTAEFLGRKYRVEWHAGVSAPESSRITQVSAVCFTGTGEIVLVSGDGGSWGLPGGHPEAGESPEDALKREVREEACAEIVASEYLGYQKCTPEAGGESDIQLRYAALINLLPFKPTHEASARRSVAPADFLKTLAWGHTEIAADLARLATASLPRLPRTGNR